MNTITSFVQRHSLLTFFVLAYGFSWGSYYLLSAPFLFPFGAILAALIVASLSQGRGGLKELWSRCVRWRVGVRWYAVALSVPVGLALGAAGLNILLGAQVSTAVQLAPWFSFFTFFPLALLDAPLMEETGWRGYAMPRFSSSRSPLTNTLILGVLLAGWHLPLALGAGPLAAPYLIAAVASAVVTNWIYYNTGESAMLAMVYHTAANTMGGAGFNLFQIFTGSDAVRIWWLLAAVNCAAAVVLALVAWPFRDKSSVAQKIRASSADA
jgi:membrane protease YdiL (CAAX protease family)